jgi:hypothetical protein
VSSYKVTLVTSPLSVTLLLRQRLSFDHRLSGQIAILSRAVAGTRIASEKGVPTTKRRAGSTSIEEAKRLFVEAADVQSEEVQRVGASLTDSDRAEFRAWADRYRHAGSLMEAAANWERQARATPDGAARRVSSNLAWLEAFAEVGVVFLDDGNERYVGVEEARMRLEDRIARLSASGRGEQSKPRRRWFGFGRR